MNKLHLNPTLSKDCISVGNLSACKLLLMNDSQYPWLILVPDRPNLKDMDELSKNDYIMVNNDIRLASQILKKLHNPYKINIASLGNVVSQLHIHVIARFETDKSWPKPVWGFLPPTPYSKKELEIELQKLKDLI